MKSRTLRLRRTMSKKKSSNTENSVLNITQWAIPTAILFTYVLVTLYSFSSDMKTDAKYTVRQKISDYNDSLIIDFNSKMDVTKAVAATTANVAARQLSAGDTLESVITDVVAPTVDNAYASAAKLMSKDGSGLTETGAQADPVNQESLKKCLDEKIIVVSPPYEKGGSWFVDVLAPVTDVNGNTEHALTFSFNTDIFGEIPTTSKFDGRTCYVLVSSDGTVLCPAGRRILVRGDNIFESNSIKISQATENRTKSNLSSRNAGYTDCTIDGEARVMVYDPTASAGMSIASIVTQSYIDNEVHSTYGNMESIMIRILVAMLAFLVAVLAIHLANKAVNTSHNQTLKEKAETDLLTGLLNKMSTEQKVMEYLTEAKAKDQSAILFLIDIDNFKKVNDTMGHAFGDELLAGLGLGLSTLFRATDIVGRIGGDEFLVLMRNITPDAETKKREADKLLTFFRDFKVGEYVQYRCTASIGGAVFSQDGGDFEELYKAADNAMYESKRHGKNRVAYYGEELEGPVIELGRH